MYSGLGGDEKVLFPNCGAGRKKKGYQNDSSVVA
jgi:hypothetical protein